MNRRKILIVSGLSALSVIGGGLIGRGAIAPVAHAASEGLPEHVMGEATAPVTLVEYASLTCPHCATFHTAVMPGLKKDWIDTGKARLIYRHFPLDALALRAAALSECVDGMRFFGFIDLLFATQQQWARSEDPIGALKALGRQAGIDDAKAEACMTNEQELTAVMDQRKTGADEFGVNSTPSLLINGEKFEGGLSNEILNKELSKLTGG